MNQESPSKPIHLSEVDGAADRLVADLDRAARWGLWALPAWALLLLLGTLTHQPDPRTEFESFARYVLRR
jgi:hypothetical protein